MENEIVQAAQTAVKESHSILEFLFGPVGQWVVLGLIAFLFFGKKIGSFLGGFKKFRVGNALVGVEAETHEDKEGITSCPHTHCKEARNKTASNMWDRIDALKGNDERLTNAVEEINKCVCTLHEDMTKAFEKLDELSIDQLKLVFYNKEMPAAERLISGLRYVSRGHNHQFKADVIDEAVNNPDMYEAAIAAAPKFRVKEVDEKLGGGGY